MVCVFSKVLHINTSRDELNSNLEKIGRWAFKWKMHFKQTKKQTKKRVYYINYFKNDLTKYSHQKHLDLSGLAPDSKLDFNIQRRLKNLKV